MIDEWPGASTVGRFDPETGVQFVICLDSILNGPAAGGTRATHYADRASAIEDAQRLAGAMTLKMAVCGLPMGGGKSVISLPVPREQLTSREWERILAIHAENIEMLGGNYWTGPDVNTTSADMDVLAGKTRYVFGRSEAAGGVGSSAPTTALGVHSAMRATAAHLGWGTLDGRTVLIQGVGAVGADLASRVADDGARVIVADPSPARLAEAERRGYAVVSTSDVLTTPCDVFAPCALGGIIDSSVAATLPAHAVVGAANNPLADATASQVLADRGVVFAPDFVANAGGALHLVGREVLGWGAEEVDARAAGLGKIIKAAYDLADRERIPTDAAARFIAAGRSAVPA
ncbi:Glu/Leu/Phe/Val dehydrogenase dimerization domain-containing protein [Microbacterium ureisolvens]|uniref:Glu/Leu/Phe/Val dehydrogenase n=1 Tax=Microbacterium ureisolvens TaxID=2781186 RepID=A0ABS7I021_9MICO|nr:Glu/Leu/Phe/Val dehydrogenase dimerization domain-containing protein [Microbacterium ureisolvens]MBW9110673.1 Glu/Leu/Phe/Val dehydrogenase [Microbacterium ureisolvens]